jgi:3-methylcrotonyl-CoA carboxylase alpha subunit
MRMNTTTFPTTVSKRLLRQFPIHKEQRRHKARLEQLVHSFSSTPSTDFPKLEDTIQKVLIANRGEIACRIIRTCRRLGIRTVAIYSSADGPHCLHATMADEAYQIGIGPASSESYLRSDDILDIAQRTGTCAVHPGFGFLSERASFAQQIQDFSNTHHRPLLFVGPPVQAMKDMASKSRAKQMMDLAGVPVTPGYDPYSNERSLQNADGTSIDIDEATMQDQLYERAVHHVGFPLLIKALMGGGGKGMRLVHAANEFKEALRSCQNEALQSFGDTRVLLERYLIHPRHIEIQVIGDQYGNIVHLFERDCSVQRRHQKVLEEAPASDLSSSFRNYIGQLGVRAATAVQYVNAGTVEFLLDTYPHKSSSQACPGLVSSSNDDDTQLRYPGIYFCEMNTRLQVEHSVTEQITGIDLVEWQLRVTAGEQLPIIQQELIPQINGHSIEARIYAETPTKQFLPSPGYVWYHRPPTPPNTDTDPITGIRVDTGLQSGQQVSVYYDPMIAKLICHGNDRNEAIQRMQRALQNYRIAGVANNIDFLLRCVQHPTYQRAELINTGFLEMYGDELLDECVQQDVIRKTHPMARVTGAMALLLRMEHRITNCKDRITHNRSPWSSHSGSWRMGGDSARVQRKIYFLPDKLMMTCISNRDGSFDMKWTNDDTDNETVSHAFGTLSDDGSMELMVNHTQRLTLTTAMNNIDGVVQVRMWPEIGKGHRNDYYWEVDLLDPMSTNNSEALREVSSVDGVVVTPMPGKVSRINFNVGDVVRIGDVIVVLEAMKMEHPCISPCNGILSEIRIVPNMVVMDSAVLFVVTASTLTNNDMNLD